MRVADTPKMIDSDTADDIFTKLQIRPLSSAQRCFTALDGKAQYVAELGITTYREFLLDEGQHFTSNDGASVSCNLFEPTAPWLRTLDCRLCEVLGSLSKQTH